MTPEQKQQLIDLLQVFEDFIDRRYAATIDKMQTTAFVSKVYDKAQEDLGQIRTVLRMVKACNL